VLEAELKRRSRNKFDTFFPDEGPRRRELYAKHVAFFAAGAKYKERLFMAANRVGKSESGAYETTCHLTGLYPKFWKGRRFNHPVEWWACGTNSETTRDIVQTKLFGSIDNVGTGMVPGDLIKHSTPRRSGLSGALESVWVKHVSGGTSVVGLKTYEQGRSSFEGTAKHGIWCDEEPPMDCYTEMLYRTVTTRGIVLVTFTPLQGLSEVVTSFLEPSEEAREFKMFIQAGWDDVPHIDSEEKRALIATTPKYQIAARTKGTPALGVGAIYPIEEDEITCKRFEIPKHWPRFFALDVGWKRTAALWFAWDRETNRKYLYHEHYRAEAEPAIHAAAIKAPGAWIPGVVDPACIGSNQADGRNLLDLYRKLELDIEPADNAVESGIFEVWQALSSGELKVFADLANWLSEYRKYHRDAKGRVVKENDHLMDCTRYGMVSGLARAKTEPVKKERSRRDGGSTGGWMA
jgi:phage terminase large subunit-like protein